MLRKKKQESAAEHTEENKGAAQEERSSKKGKKRNPDTVRRFRNTAFALIVVILLGTIVSMVASQLLPEYAVLSMPRRIVAAVMRPVQEAFSSGSGWFFNYMQRLKLRSNIEYEYEKLYEQYDELLNQAMMVKELQEQLSEYQELMDEMQTHSQFDGVPARVISTDSTNYFSVLELNVGSNQGVANYMAVVKSGGLVGYTYDVTATTCKVQTIINSDTSIPALIEATRYQGTVKGTMGIDGQPMCRMYYLSDNHLPRQGDTVITSGVGVEFPKGIPIGVVRESTRGMEEGKSYVVIEPIVDFERIEYVTVYRYVPSYAEQAEQREENELVYTGLSTARPVPNFLGNEDDAFMGGETAAPTGEPASDNETPQPMEPDAAVTPNLSYQDTPGTPTPPPTPTPSPSPTPTPTFSLNNMTPDGED